MTRTRTRALLAGGVIALLALSGCDTRTPSVGTKPKSGPATPRATASPTAGPVDEPAAAEPTVDGVEVWTFDESGKVVDRTPLADGSTLDLEDLGADAFNFVAAPEDPTGTSSVRLVLDGPVTSDRTENDAPYTLAVQPANLSVSKGDLPPGEYSVSVTPYAQDGGKGAAGATVDVDFTVVVETPTGGEDPAPPSEAADEGFTAVTPSADSRLIYVSSSTGSDGNDCLSPENPCKSLDVAARKMRSGYPDHLYLKAGDVWRNDGVSRVGSGRSTSEPSVVTSYGEGTRPRIESIGQTRALSVNTGGRTVHHVNFIGLEIANVKLDADHPDFTGKKADSNTVMFLGGHTDLLFEDIRFDHVEIVLQHWEGKDLEDITLRRNIFTGAYTDQSSYSQSAGGRPSNIYAAGVDGLVIEQNVFDHGGWHPTAKGAAGNMYNHNLYLQNSNVGAGVVVRDNIITRASSHGIQARAGGVLEDNFFGRNAVSALVGYSKEYPLKKGTPGVARDNVITEGHSMVKGHDACKGDEVGANLCTPALWGLELSNPGTGDIDFSNNIVHSRSQARDDLWRTAKPKWRGLSADSLKLPEGGHPGVAANNITWKWENEAEGTDASYPDPGRTLGDYYTHLEQAGVVDDIVRNGYVDRARPADDDFVSFLNVVLEREPGQWDSRFTAAGINDWIRAGFGR